MQYEQLEGGKRVDLPRPSIDTGMGLERIAAVLQGTHDNYAIDLFRALIQTIADLTKVSPDGPHKASHRVIADHLRASAFLIADGVLPSNEGRGYVLRRIMARNRFKDLRRRVYHVLEQGPIGDRVSTTVDRFLVVLILVNLIAVALESIPEYEAHYGAAFAAIELFSLLVFTLEYVLRLWSAVEHGPNQHMAPMGIRL